MHKNLSEGRWRKLSLAEQLANIGAEVGRAAKWQNKDPKLFGKTVLRALELFDLTLEDPGLKGRLREIARLREVFCDAIEGGNEYATNLFDLEKYFLPFMFFVRRKAEA